LTDKVFKRHPSQEILDLTSKLFLTTNKNNFEVDTLISRNWQFLFLEEVRRVRSSFKQNLKEIDQNKMVVNYRYNFNEDNNDVFFSYTLRKIKKNFLNFRLNYRGQHNLL
jgi:hypothetical protein